MGEGRRGGGDNELGEGYLGDKQKLEKEEKLEDEFMGCQN